jgi:hypothetical protein
METMDKKLQKSDVKQWYVVYEMPKGKRNRQYGGPYTPQKAKQLKETLEKQLENGNRRVNNIPSNALGVFLSPGKRVTVEDDRRKVKWE